MPTLSSSARCPRDARTSARAGGRQLLTDVGDAVARQHAFVGVCAGCVMAESQLPLRGGHGRKGGCRWVEALQAAGVLVSEDTSWAERARKTEYCIVSGVWNRVLDENKVFEIVEMIVFFKLGLRPRSWGEPAMEWTEEEDEEEIVERL
ncbi:uncharacterized protein A4U43_C08F25960 [Asparagus officinalis]|nr:uncharacterized protein A4U43_C08F25960 [Asparagus officinalis]